MNQTQTFLSRIDAVARGEIPERVLARARLSLLDYIAVTTAGSHFLGDKLKDYLDFAQPEAGDFHAIGMGRSLALKEAVFLNGLNAHALDFDDGTNAGIIHLGSPVFTVLLPLAQRAGKDFDQLLRAAVIGYEASFTMAISIQPGHKLLGYHATGTCGVLGATLAASYMLDFSEEERANAFSTACVSATGMLKVLDDGSELKPYNVAKTALLALCALEMAKAGFRGHPDPLGGGRGFLKMMTGREDITLALPLLNGTYAIEKSYTKPYAACRYCHPSIEAAITLRGRDGVRPEDVKWIRVRTYSLAVSGHDHTHIEGSASAKMSIPYSVSAALIHGRAGLSEYEDSEVARGAVTALAEKIHVTADEGMSANFPDRQTAEVEIELLNGTVYTERVDFPKGEPENPMTEAEFLDRYDDLMRYGGRSAADAEIIYEIARQDATQVGALTELL